MNLEYVKLLTRMRDDPKIIGLSDKTFRAYVTALCWSGEHETDGKLPKGLIGDRATSELRGAGLLDGNVIHNWGKHQLLHTEMDAKRIAGRKAARSRWGNAEPNTEVEVEVRGRELEPKTAPDGALSNGNQLAAALLASDSTAQYLLSRMSERWQVAITSAALMKLGKQYGASVVTDALRNMREEDAAPEDPFPYLEKVCVRVSGAVA